jgi:hypothetical protein
MHGYVDPRPSGPEPTTAALLAGLMESERLREFLSTVHERGGTLSTEMEIPCGGSACGLRLCASHTPCGDIVFASLAPGSAVVEGGRPPDTTTTERMTRADLINRHDDALAKYAAMRRLEEDNARTLSAAVHDLKNPISSIIGSCEYLAEYSYENLAPEQREMISAIEASAQTLLQLSGRLFQLCGSGAQNDATTADETPPPNGSVDASS